MEEWRYSRIDALDLDRYRPAPPEQDGRGGELTLPAAVAGLPAATVLVVRDGRLVARRGDDPAVTVTNTPARPAGADGIAGEPDGLVALNTALSEPIEVTVAAGARPAAPIMVVHETRAAATASFPRLLVRVGAQAEVSVLEVSTSEDVEALVVPVTELDVAEGAHVGYVHVQQLGGRVWQTGVQASRVARDATLTSASVALGGDYARMRTHSSLVGPGSTARLLAVYFGAGARMTDFRTVQDHRAPNTTSELLFKGAVANQSRGVYTGMIHVEKGARGTNAFQTNRNLVLHDGAHAWSVPNLEIEDNDVRCSHASAVGPIAEDQRFYLESRGVRPEAADRLITLGFLDEVITRLPVPELAGRVRQALVATLDDAEQAERAAGGVSTGGAR